MADPTNLIGETSDPALAAVRGTHATAGAPRVLGVSPANGVIGRSGVPRIQWRRCRRDL